MIVDEYVVVHKDTIDMAIELLEKYLCEPKIPEIKKVIFNNPVTVVFWNDKTKTIVRCEGEKYDPEKGFVMAVVKKIFGNKSSYYDVIKKWVGEDKLFPEKNNTEKKDKKKSSKN